MEKVLDEATSKSFAKINFEAGQITDFMVGFQLDVLRLGLAMAFVITNALDYITTKKGLEAGLVERNPFARAIMRMGWRKYQAFKFIPTALHAYQGLVSDDPYFVWSTTLAIGTGFFLYASIQNFLLILGRGLERGEASPQL